MARSLIADAISIRDAHLTPREWSLMLGEFVNAYIRPEGAIDEQVRDRFLEAIETIGESELNVGADVVRVGARGDRGASRRPRIAARTIFGSRHRDRIVYLSAIDPVQNYFCAGAERRHFSRARSQRAAGFAQAQARGRRRISRRARPLSLSRDGPGRARADLFLLRCAQCKDRRRAGTFASDSRAPINFARLHRREDTCEADSDTSDQPL